VWLTDELQLDPERRTSMIVVPDRGAKHFIA
jgi:hypothetical protein